MSFELCIINFVNRNLIIKLRNLTWLKMSDCGTKNIEIGTTHHNFGCKGHTFQNRMIDYSATIFDLAKFSFPDQVGKL
jgi:hypothetical protein